MANYYTHLSFTVAVRDAERLVEVLRDHYEWAQAAHEASEPVPEGHGNPFTATDPDPCGLWIEADENGEVWISDDETVEPVLAAQAAQWLLAQPEAIDTVVGFEWADTGSRPLTDAYGGGAGVVTAEGYWLEHTSATLERLLAEHAPPAAGG